jgi:hypothetical protein
MAAFFNSTCHGLLVFFLPEVLWNMEITVNCATFLVKFCTVITRDEPTEKKSAGR